VASRRPFLARRCSCRTRACEVVVLPLPIAIHDLAVFAPAAVAGTVRSDTQRVDDLAAAVAVAKAALSHDRSPYHEASSPRRMALLISRAGSPTTNPVTISQPGSDTSSTRKNSVAPRIQATPNEHSETM